MEPDSNLAAALAQAWRRWPERVVLVQDDRRITYREYGKAVSAVAGAYRRLGVTSGERILCCVSNRPEYLVALGAAWTAGAVHAGVDHQSTGPELATVVALTGATTLLYEPPTGAVEPWAALREVRRAHPDLRIVVLGPATAGGGREAGGVPAGCMSWASLAEPATEPELDPAPAPEDTAIIFITSGTTGAPKATMGFHGNLAQRWRRLGGWLRFGPEDVHLAQLPLSHGFGLMMAVAALLAGGRLVLLDGFSADRALAAVTTEGVTVLNGAPAHFKLILNRLDGRRVDRLRLSVGTAAPFPPELVRSIWDRLGVRFMFMYGSSEGVGVATTDDDDILRGSVGRPEPGSVAVMGPDRRPLPVGSVGEVAFSRGVYPVRYWGHEQPPESWYYSGDLGRVDEEGRLYIFGRIKHQIDRGGLKVDPVEVEGALLRHPDVADAAVIGRPNPVLEETVCACVAPMPGRTPTLAELRDFLGASLAPFKLPEELFVLDAIPRTPIGKVNLDRLRDEIDALPSQRLARR